MRLQREQIPLSNELTKTVCTKRILVTVVQAGKWKLKGLNTLRQGLLDQFPCSFPVMDHADGITLLTNGFIFNFLYWVH